MVGDGNPQLTCWFLIHVILNHISRFHIVCLIGWVFLYPPPNHILKLSVRNSVVPVYKGTSHFRGWPSLEVSQLYNSLLLVASLLEKTYPPEFLLCPTLPPYCSGLAKTDFFFFPFEASSLLIHKVKNYIMFKSATNKALGISDA